MRMLFQVPIPRPELSSLNTYAPSKHAITALTEVLRHELTFSKNKKIRVSSLSPGETKTEICNSTTTGTSDDYYKLNPALDAENVAEGVHFILSLPYTVQVSELTMRCVGARV
jgi:NADP+-dependent farnesol dehydrogenase